MKKISVILVFILASCAPVVLADLYLKSQRLPAQNSRVMTLGGGFLNTLSNGVRGYSPNSLIRHAAIYGEEIEYDYLFTTDSHGFRRTFTCNNHNKKQPLFAISGDSFTEGQGSSYSWATDIQTIACDLGSNSINTAIAGSGLLEMEKSLIYAKKSLGAKKALIAIILDDIYRPYQELSSNSECSAYLHNSVLSCGKLATWWHIPFSATTDELIKLAKRKSEYGVIPAIKLLRENISLNTKKAVKKAFFPSYQSPKRLRLIKDSSAAVSRIAMLYGVENISLLLLPTKTDRLKNDIASSQEISQSQEDLRVFKLNLPDKLKFYDIRSCNLNKNHFHVFDGHPNETGQKKIGECAYKALKNTEFFAVF